MGATLVVNGVPREVIGVLPQWFRFFDYPADIYYPLQPVRANASFPAGDGRGIARLKPGVTLGDANRDVARIIPILDEEFPGGSAEQWELRPKLAQAVSRGFFETLLTPLIAGRSIVWDDVYQRRRVVLVSENLARAAWGSAGAALGKRISTSRTGPWSEVVGVVKDVHHDG